MGIGAVGAIFGGVGSATLIPPVLRQFSYELNRLDPNLLIDPASLISLKLRGEASDADFYSTMKAQGYSAETADYLFKLTRQLLAGADLIALERRGEISREAVDERAALLGWMPEAVTELYRISEVLPSANDIIRYAVREVYSPEIATAFGQFEGLEAVLDAARADIKASGMSEDTFKKEWAAHWLLPSVMQGYEMLHRGVIPAASSAAEPLSLDRLMVALDIMPAWRDKLTAISYSPFTRVDVRRMHKIGVLSDTEIVQSYKDLGYDDAKAAKMAEFTLLYNADPPEDEKTGKDEDKARERDLTKSDVLTGLRDGLLSPEEVTDALGSLGYDPDEIDYYLAKVEFNREKDELTDTVEYLHDAYIKGVIDFAQITDDLGKLNLPARMTEYYLKIWGLEKVARTNKPTKSELMTFLRKEIIDQATWRAEMLGLGYPERYINWYGATV